MLPAHGPLGTTFSGGGMPDRVKCLHVVIAHALAKGPGVNPFGDEASLREFARATGIVFGTLTGGVPVAIDTGTAPLPDGDAEDAA